MDSLKVELSVGTYTDTYEDGVEKTYHYLEQKIWVNSKLFKGYCNLTGLFEDTWLTSTKEELNSWYSQEHKQQNLSVSRNSHQDGWSSVYLDSCSCGHAGCSGIWNGVKVYKKKNAYHYKAKKSQGYPNGILGSGKWSLWFTKDNILEVRKYLKDFVADNLEICQNANDESYHLVRYLNLTKG